MSPPRSTSPCRSTCQVLASTVLAVVVVVSALGGCYKKVVGARGLGASGVRVEEPTPPTLLDRMFGPEPAPADSRPRMRVN